MLTDKVWFLHFLVLNTYEMMPSFPLICTYMLQDVAEKLA